MTEGTEAHDFVYIADVVDAVLRAAAGTVPLSESGVFQHLQRRMTTTGMSWRAHSD